MEEADEMEGGRQGSFREGGSWVPYQRFYTTSLGRMDFNTITILSLLKGCLMVKPQL